MTNTIKVTKINYVFITLQYIAALMTILLVKTELGIAGEFVKNVLFYILIFIIPNIIIIRKVYRDKVISYLKLNFKFRALLTGMIIAAFMTLIFLISNHFKTNDITLNTSQILMLTGGMLAGVFEEIAFRGFYLNFFTSKFNFVIASIITATLFSLLHIRQIVDQGIIQFVMLFALSLFLNYAFEKTKSLWVPIIIHITFNTLIFLFR